MKIRSKKYSGRLLCAAALSSLGFGASGLAISVQADDQTIEEVVVTGTRKAGVAPTQTLSPVDVFGGDRLMSQGSFDLTDSLSAVSPSLNTQRFPIADGTAMIRPVTLRNLSPDHTLVLVNGTRRHRSALVNLQLAPLGTVNQGSQGVDWSAFPSAAIQRVEVLRDGASAQYGSDAIAGVINVILKDDDEGVSFSAQAGEYGQGDGDRFSFSANAGMSLTDKGFLNVTGELSSSDITSRGNARPDAAAVATILGSTSSVPINGFGQRWGDPDVEAFKLTANTGFDLSDTVELYGFATYMDKEMVSDFFYRGPVLDPSNETGARETLQRDADGDFRADPATVALVTSITAQGLTPSDYLTANASSVSGYDLLNPIHTKFPGGYNPDFGANIEDLAFVFGVRGEINSNLSFDIRGRTAENEVEYTIGETINPSLGKLSPTSFKPGTLTQEETSINADFVQTFDDSALNVAYGLEVRNETYKIGAGDAASVQTGPTYSIFGVGSDGFQGFPAESAGDFESDSWAVYLDVEQQLSERLTGAFALRYEDFDEFDTTSDFKLSGRYELVEGMAVRATFNTGFRTPTPGQVHTLNITTTSDITGALIPNGTYPVDHPVALALGSKNLEAEESTSFTLGLVNQFSDDMTFTIDYYQIEIDDRLALLNNTISAANVVTLQAASVANAALLLNSSANYFVNGFDSEISGVDVAVTRDFDNFWNGAMQLDLRYNWNEQQVSGVSTGTINASRVYDLENQVPESSFVATADYSRDKLSALLRLRYYGEYSTTGGLFSPPDGSDRNSYDGNYLFDLEVNYELSDNYQVSIGGENIFDAEPDNEQNGTLQFLGVDRALTSPYGFNGSFWYARVSAAF